MTSRSEGVATFVTLCDEVEG